MHLLFRYPTLYHLDHGDRPEEHIRHQRSIRFDIATNLSKHRHYIIEMMRSTLPMRALLEQHPFACLLAGLQLKVPHFLQVD